MHNYPTEGPGQDMREKQFLTTEEQNTVERIISLLCFISLGFLILFISLSFPALELVFDGSGSVIMFLSIVLPMIHQGLGTYLLWKKVPLGWYLIYCYILTSLLFNLLGLASTVAFNLTGEYLLDYVTALPLPFYLIHLAIHAVLAVFLLRENLRWYLTVTPVGIRQWSFVSFILFFLYLAPYYFHF